MPSAPDPAGPLRLAPHPSIPEIRQERLVAIVGNALLDESHQIADLAGLAQVGCQAIKARANALLLRGNRREALALGGFLLPLNFAPQLRLPLKRPLILILVAFAGVLLQIRPTIGP